MTARRIPVRRLTRVVVDNDHAADPDGLVTLTHQLLLESTEVRAITSTSIPTGFPGEEAIRGTAHPLVEELLDRLDPLVRPPSFPDTTEGFASLTEVSPGAGAIVAEALTQDERPLILACGGPLTNVAAALRAEPAIADRLTLAWIGGAGFPDGGWEYNLTSDLAAARYVFNETSVPIWQFPLPVYRQCLYSIAEMEWDLTTAGEFGTWLYEQFTAPPEFVDLAGSWPMGDSPVVLPMSLGTESSTYDTLTCPSIGEDLTYGPSLRPREHRIYRTVDFRLIIGDFLARLRLHAAETTRRSLGDQT